MLLVWIYFYFREIYVGFCRATEDATTKFLWGSGPTDRYGIGVCDLEQLAIDHVAHQLCPISSPIPTPSINSS